MDNNVFSFGDAYWLEKSGAAMGTLAAPLYATITYRVHENINSLPKFANNIIYYKRYIDDVFCIWLPSTDDTWDDFRLSVNNFGNRT
jgi:hypothetical protein